MACEFHQLEKDNFGTDLNDMGLKKMSINMTCDFHYVNYILFSTAQNIDFSSITISAHLSVYLHMLSIHFTEKILLLL